MTSLTSVGSLDYPRFVAIKGQDGGRVEQAKNEMV